MLNANTLTAALAGLVVGGALADALEGVYVLATGAAGVGAAIGVLYATASSADDGGGAPATRSPGAPTSRRTSTLAASSAGRSVRSSGSCWASSTR